MEKVLVGFIVDDGRRNSYNLGMFYLVLKCEVILRMEKWLVWIYLVKIMKVGIDVKCVYFVRLLCLFLLDI